ncbi:hypothetical protein ACP275_04G080100 [Erythranthe tilingii]
MGSKHLSILLLVLSVMNLRASACKKYHVVIDLDYPRITGAFMKCPAGGSSYYMHTLSAVFGTVVSWKFCESIFGKTVYTCEFKTTNETITRTFDVFNSDFADSACRSGTCYWLVSDQNFYIHNDFTDKNEGWHTWGTAPTTPDHIVPWTPRKG